jgi:hypothetical protein
LGWANLASLFVVSFQLSVRFEVADGYSGRQGPDFPLLIFHFSAISCHFGVLEKENHQWKSEMAMENGGFKFEVQHGWLRILGYQNRER